MRYVYLSEPWIAEHNSHATKNRWDSLLRDI